MRAYELFEKDFGIEGQSKQKLTQFITRSINDTFSILDGTSSNITLATSMSKRLVGNIMPHLFYIRNIVRGKEKYFSSKFSKLMNPQIVGMINAIHNDHSDETEYFSDSKFVKLFVAVLLKKFADNKHQFVSSTFNN